MGIDDLEDALESAEAIIDQGLWYLRDQSNPEESQVFLYELAHARSALSIAQSLKILPKGEKKTKSF